MSSINGRSGPRLGCFGYGCAIALVLLVATLGGAGYYIVASIRSAFLVYTVKSAPKLQVSPSDPALAVAARSKLDALAVALRENSSTIQELSSDELEAFIQTTTWRDFAVVSLDKDRVRVDFSFPITALGEWPSARLLLGTITERAVYGSAEGSLSVAKGVSTVSFSRLILNDNVLEEMARGHASTWVSGALDSWSAEALERGSAPSAARNLSIEVRDGRVIVSVAP